MPASMIASLIVFIITGIYTLGNYSLPFSSSPITRWLVFFTLIANGCYFFLVEMWTEVDRNKIKNLRKYGWSEWILRVVAQCVLFSLWFVLQLSWNYFLVIQVLLYFIYLFWDWITWDEQDTNKLSIIDLFGTVLAFIMLILLGTLSKQFIYLNTHGKAVLGLLQVHYIQKINQYSILSLDHDLTLVLLGMVTVLYWALFIVSAYVLKFNFNDQFQDYINNDHFLD